MKFLNLGSIGKNLILLVLLAVLPAVAILIYTGMEQRTHSIENAKGDIQLLTRAMAETQRDITTSARQTLSTLSLLPEIQDLNVPRVKVILAAVLEKNPDFQNIALTNAQGEVLASGIASNAINLKDRKHVREALTQKQFAVGEYILTRVGVKKPAFPYAYPVIDTEGNVVGVLTLAISLDRFSRIHTASPLTEKSFLAITDHQGVRLYYYPPREDSNPVGKRIGSTSWEKASSKEKAGRFISKGSDGIQRIFAFEQVCLSEVTDPYVFVWAGIPESYILSSPNIALVRNLTIMLAVVVLALLTSWYVGQRTMILPITSLVGLVNKFGEGELDLRHDHVDAPDEFGTLTNAFYDMAGALSVSQKLLREDEARFRLIMDSLDAFVYVADMASYEVLFVNEYGQKNIGAISGGVCWQTIQKGQSGPCDFCTNRFLLNSEGTPGEQYTWEFYNETLDKWYFIQDRAITWIDGRIVRLEIATDITEMKQAEENLAQEKERLDVTLQSIGDGVITTNTEGGGAHQRHC